MLRIAFAASALLAAGSAGAATLYDPQVAYTVVSGTSTNLMLANADGSRAVKVASYRGLLTGLDFAPGGGRIAYLDGQGIKVLAYTASDTGITVTGVQTLAAAASGVGFSAPDFSPDGTRIAYIKSTSTVPQAVRVVAASTGAELASFTCSPCDNVRWLRAGPGDGFAYIHYVNAKAEIWTALVNGDGSVTAGPVLTTAGQAFGAIGEFDVAHTRDALVFVAAYATGSRQVEFDLYSQALTDRGAGERPHFSSDDSAIVGRSPHSSSGDYVVSTDVATGLQTRLTKKGNYGATDARP
jgi:hypothetical protein